MAGVSFEHRTVEAPDRDPVRRFDRDCGGTFHPHVGIFRQRTTHEPSTKGSEAILQFPTKIIPPAARISLNLLNLELPELGPSALVMGLQLNQPLRGVFEPVVFQHIFAIDSDDNRGSFYD